MTLKDAHLLLTLAADNSADGADNSADDADSTEDEGSESSVPDPENWHPKNKDDALSYNRCECVLLL